MERTMGTRPHARVRAMVECAMLLAAYMVLSRIKFFSLPQGGDITPAAGLPLLMIGYRHGPKWACISAVAAALLGMLLDGFYAPPAGTAASLALCLLLDYFLSKFSIVAAAGFTHLMKKKNAVTIGICVFVSGFLLWGSYAPEGMNVIYYSFAYNGSYCIPEAILITVVAVALYRTAPRLFSRQ